MDLVARLCEAGCRVERISKTHELNACREVLADAQAWIAGVAPVTCAHLDAAPRLKILARYGVGYDSVDLTAAASRGVIVTNTPGANSEAVADHALALTLAALRGVVGGDRSVRSGHWVTQRGREISALTIGVVGAGRIGLAFADRVRALGARVLAHDPYSEPAVELELVRLTELMTRCDVISLHLPGGTPLITAPLLATARPALVLVNTARADLVDENAVAKALRAGGLAAFATDTLLDEGRGAISPVLDHDLADRVIVTPHTAAQTVQAIDAMGSMAVDDVLAVLTDSAPTHRVEDR